MLTGYDWPRNVRQLANEVRHLVTLSLDDDVIGADRLTPEIRAENDSLYSPAAALVEGKIVINANLPCHKTKDEAERQLLVRAHDIVD